jgi:LysM repeat protein
MRKHIVGPGDTLGKIAKQYYGDAALYERLAKYNGIFNPDIIIDGRIIEIPSKAELIGVPPEPPAEDYGVAVPHGLQEIMDTFGDITKYIAVDGTLKPQWESKYLCRAKLPFPMRLSWDPSKEVRSIYCHVELKEILPEVFRAIEIQGMKGKVKTYGGCFNFRSKRTSGKLSTHSWGIAIDLNPETNAMGMRGDMYLGIVGVFKGFGFAWGGDWSGYSKDPMHFQFCTGY